MTWLKKLSPVKRRATTDDRGAAAVEFALVLPLLVGVLFGIIQFGALFFLHNNMVNAAREAARKMAVGEATTNAQAQTVATTYLASWGLTFTATATGAGAVAGTDQVVTITVPMKSASLIDVIGLFSPSSNPLLRATVTMRKE
jgi:Flp pilus assembly protein TadG